MLTASFAILIGLHAGPECPRCTTDWEGIPSLTVVDVVSGFSVNGEIGVTLVKTNRAGCQTTVVHRSIDRGVTWSAPQRVDLDPVYLACDVYDSSGLSSDGRSRLFYPYTARASGTGPATAVVTVSEDLGTTWPPAVSVIAPLGASSSAGIDAVIATADGRAWAFLIDGPTDAELHAYVSRSNDGGRTWDAPTRIDAGVTDPVPVLSAARDPDGVLLVVFATADAAGGRLFATRSVDDGQTWSASMAIDGLAGSTYMPGASVHALGNGVFTVVWLDLRGGREDLWSQVTRDGGQTWLDQPARIDTGDPVGASKSWVPRVDWTGSGQELVAIWVDRRTGTRQVFANRTRDGGETWEAAATAISAPDPGSIPLHMAVVADRNGMVTAVWRDDGREWMTRCGAPNCPALYLARSCDGGATWEPDGLVVDRDGAPNEVDAIDFGHGGVGIVFERQVNVGYLRVDGATAVEPKGPTSYCLGSDPPLDAFAVTAACPGGYALQWYLDGIAVPGATGLTWQPSLAAGSHTVEVRGACLTVPDCSPPAEVTELRVFAPAMPPGVGNHLRAVRSGAEVALTWSGAPAAPDAHGHVRRANAKGVTGSLVAPDPGLAVSAWRDAPPAGEPLWLYDVRRADPCEVESAD